MKWNMILGSLMLGASLCTPSFGGGLLDHMLGLKGSGCDSACCDTGCAADPTCGCETNACDPCAGADPACGCEIAACDPCAGAGPACGCEVNACDPCAGAPSCGCETACQPCCPPRRPLRELLHAVHCKSRALIGRLHHHKACCDSGCASAPACGCEVNACDPCAGAAPACGCEVNACDPCAAPSCGVETACCDSVCGKRHCGGLLSKLFRKRSNCCDAIVCDSCSGCAAGAPAVAPEAEGDEAPMPPAPSVDPSAYLQTNRRVIQATSFVR
ncbi:MAG: hypothetical protein KatS3mg111_1541 [Pirellulaceae bacterium]|nr:MAG: hypothetical protein KatS3mg111_1541 [Pirellulaceae bacterium]